MLFYLLVNLAMWMWHVETIHEATKCLFAFFSFIEMGLEIWILIAFINWYMEKRKK